MKTLQLKKVGPKDSMPDGHFFNSSSFLQTRPFTVAGWQLIKERPVAQIFFAFEEGKAVSGKQATFGSFDLDEDVSEEELNWFIQALIAELKSSSIREVEIRHYPSYFKNADIVKTGLLANRFKIIVDEIDQFIPVSRKAFHEVARRDEVLRSDQCIDLGIRFEIAQLDKLPQIYNLVESTLQRNGHTPSLSFDHLKAAIASCPDKYILFTLWDKEILVAATVSVVISDAVLYDFYHADNPEYRPKSPMTHLLKNIYEYCQSNGFQILDLGISTESGKVNEGLFNFKKQRGAISCSKGIFHLSLNDL